MRCSAGRMRNRIGFTVVELLVVIAVIGILVSLLLPALSAVRESGRAVTCRNHLRQTGLAVLQYAEARDGALPTLWKSARAQPWQNFSWRVDVLPFLDQQNLYDAMDLRQSPLTAANLPFVGQQIAVFQCPSSPGTPRELRSIGHGESRVDGVSLGAHDYVAVHDVQSPSRTFPLRGPWNGGADLELTQSAPDFTERDDMNPSLRVKQAFLSAVRDGLSQTTLVIEQAGKPTVHGAPLLPTPREPTEGAWATGEFSSFRGEGVNHDNLSDPYGFHNAAHIVMCDASVHRWSSDLDARVMRALMSRDGGEIISDGDWR